MPTHLENETAVVADAQAGDHDAFTQLVRQYDRHIYRLAMNITGDPTEAEDVLQDAFLKAYENLPRFQGNSRFYTWLVRIAVNEALMKLRKRRGSSWVSVDDPVETDDSNLMPREMEDWHENPEERYARSELNEILFQAMDSLELPYRTVFVLRDMEDLSTEETAEALGLSVAAVKSRLLRARLKMRQRLNKYFRKG